MHASGLALRQRRKKNHHSNHIVVSSLPKTNPIPRCVHANASTTRSRFHLDYYVYTMAGYPWYRKPVFRSRSFVFLLLWTGERALFSASSGRWPWISCSHMTFFTIHRSSSLWLPILVIVDDLDAPGPFPHIVARCACLRVILCIVLVRHNFTAWRWRIRIHDEVTLSFFSSSWSWSLVIHSMTISFQANHSNTASKLKAKKHTLQIRTLAETESRLAKPIHLQDPTPKAPNFWIPNARMANESTTHTCASKHYVYEGVTLYNTATRPSSSRPHHGAHAIAHLPEWYLLSLRVSRRFPRLLYLVLGLTEDVSGWPSLLVPFAEQEADTAEGWFLPRVHVTVKSHAPQQITTSSKYTVLLPRTFLKTISYSRLRRIHPVMRTSHRTKSRYFRSQFNMAKRTAPGPRWYRWYKLCTWPNNYTKLEHIFSCQDVFFFSSSLKQMNSIVIEIPLLSRSPQWHVNSRA